MGGLISPNPSANMSQWKNAKMFPKQRPRKCVVIVHPTRFIEAKDPLSQNLQNIPVPVHPMAVPMPVHPTVHPIAVPMPVHPTVHPMAVPIPVHPTKFIKANDLLSQNLQNMVVLHPPKSAILYTRKSAIRSPPLMDMGLISPNPSANMSQWKNAKMFPKQNATMFPRMNAKMCPNKYPKKNAAKFPKSGQESM